jgi:threonine dehydrogenase-like Zn-dependent dehydrogenase
VLVTGLGPVGNLAAQVFHRCGYEVLACDPQPARRADASRVGLRDVRPAVPADDPALVGQFSLVIDCSSHEKAVLDGCRMVRKRGEVVLIGTPWQRRTEIYAQELLSLVFFNYVILRSGWEWEVPGQPADFRQGSLWANYAAALRWLAEGQVSVAGLSAAAAPRDVQQVYQNLLHQRTSALATVFDWTGR